MPEPEPPTGAGTGKEARHAADTGGIGSEDRDRGSCDVVEHEGEDE